MHLSIQARANALLIFGLTVLAAAAVVLGAPAARMDLVSALYLGAVILVVGGFVLSAIAEVREELLESTGRETTDEPTGSAKSSSDTV